VLGKAYSQEQIRSSAGTPAEQLDVLEAVGLPRLARHRKHGIIIPMHRSGAEEGDIPCKQFLTDRGPTAFLEPAGTSQPSREVNNRRVQLLESCFPELYSSDELRLIRGDQQPF
jgi:hypothetical protein